MKIKSLVLVLLLNFIACFLNAQKPNKYNVVLKNGAEMEAYVIKIIPDSIIDLVLINGKRININSSEVLKIESVYKNNYSSNFNTTLPSPFNNKNYYWTGDFGLGLSLIKEPSFFGSFSTVYASINAQCAGGYRYSKYLGIGGFAGVSYYWFYEKAAKQLGVKVLGILKSSKITPIYNFNLGYGLINKTPGIEEKGGIYKELGFGFLFKRRNNQSGFTMVLSHSTQKMTVAVNDFQGLTRLQKSLASKTEFKLGFIF